MTPLTVSAQNNQQEVLPQFEEGTSVILSGIVVDTQNAEFTMNTNNAGMVTVELEEWNWDLSNEAERLLNPGDEITVSGVIDDDFFENREISANNIYVTEEFVYYYVVDTEPAYIAAGQELPLKAYPDGTFVKTRGEVQTIRGREMDINTGEYTVTVDTVALPYNPFDGTGQQKVEEGNRVMVYGQVDNNFIQDREISADTIIRLEQVFNNKSQNKTAKNSS